MNRILIDSNHCNRESFYFTLVIRVPCTSVVRDPLDIRPPFWQTTISNAFSWMAIWNPDSNFNEIYSKEPNWQQASIGSGNSLAPNRRQAIAGANGNQVYWGMYATVGGNELSVRRQKLLICVFIKSCARTFAKFQWITNWFQKLQLAM